MSEVSRKEVVLVTGGSGFLGGHIVNHLLNEDEDRCAREIRILDKVPTTSTGRTEAKNKLPVSFEADLCEMEKCRTALRGVDVVIHCAALVSYDFPPDKKSLDRNNVEATDNLIKLCIEENVTCFINCSTTEVTLKPCVTGGIIAMAVYPQESRSQPPDDENRLIFREYAASKLRAERIVLAANGTRLKNGGIFRTVSLRPPLLYGEGDRNIVSGILYAAKSRGNSLTKLAGLGGKQEIAYVGNAAWAFVCAKNTILHYPDGIAGLPVFINDDTTVENIFRFCERLTRNTNHHISLSGFIPIPISYSIAWLAEIAIICFPFLIGGKKKFPISPRSMIAYLGSMILHNRIRASIYLNYSPIFNREEALKLSSDYYSKIFA